MGSTQGVIFPILQDLQDVLNVCYIYFVFDYLWKRRIFHLLFSPNITLHFHWSLDWSHDPMHPLTLKVQMCFRYNFCNSNFAINCLCKTTSREHKSDIWGFSELKCFHCEIFIAVFCFCAVLGLLETQKSHSVHLTQQKSCISFTDSFYCKLLFCHIVDDKEHLCYFTDSESPRVGTDRWEIGERSCGTGKPSEHQSTRHLFWTKTTPAGKRWFIFTADFDKPKWSEQLNLYALHIYESRWRLRNDLGPTRPVQTRQTNDATSDDGSTACRCHVTLR